MLTKRQSEILRIIVENYVEFLLFINREQLMDLVNNLYDKAADIND